MGFILQTRWWYWLIFIAAILIIVLGLLLCSNLTPFDRSDYTSDEVVAEVKQILFGQPEAAAGYNFTAEYVGHGKWSGIIDPQPGRQLTWNFYEESGVVEVCIRFPPPTPPSQTPAYSIKDYAKKLIKKLIGR